MLVRLVPQNVPEELDGSWKALPYEAAGAAVRSLMIHCRKLGEAQAAMEKALLDDPSQVKAVTKKLVERATGLLHVDRYLVFNPRTGQLATEMWLAKHIQVVDGKPQFKNANKKHKTPKILTLTVKIENGKLQLFLDLQCGGGPQPLRCYDLRSSEPQGDLQFLQVGFGHMADPWVDDALEGDDADFDDVRSEPDENDFEDEMMADEQGLFADDHDPAPANVNDMAVMELVDDDKSDDNLGDEGEDVWEFKDEEIKDLKHADMSDSMMKVLNSVEKNVSISKPKTFGDRPTYVALESEGLVELPPVKGIFLSFHAASSQWHGGYPKSDGTVANRAPKFATGLRSERKALLLCLEFLWQNHFKQTGQGTDQLTKLAAALAAED
eukprot:Skav222593  [mRNA]  locus=scaffold1852:30316:32970:+ [translate_table: standard]